MSANYAAALCAESHPQKILHGRESDSKGWMNVRAQCVREKVRASKSLILLSPQSVIENDVKQEEHHEQTFSNKGLYHIWQEKNT